MPINLEDQELILKLSSSASLADAPGDQDNWIERTGPGGRGGELPPYVRKLARGIMKSGKSKAHAIAIAISRIKRWAAGGEDVDPDTRAKAAAALAEWEALKAKSHSVKLSAPYSVSDTRVTIEDSAETSATSEEVDDILTENELVLLSRYIEAPTIEE